MEFWENPRELCKYAEEIGVLNLITYYHPHTVLEIPLKQSFLDTSTGDLPLSVRSINGLMRAGLTTVGKVCEKIMTPAGLQSLRCIGRKSVAEIKTCILTEAYDRLDERGRISFWEKVVNDHKKAMGGKLHD